MGFVSRETWESSALMKPLGSGNYFPVNDFKSSDHQTLNANAYDGPSPGRPKMTLFTAESTTMVRLIPKLLEKGRRLARNWDDKIPGHRVLMHAMRENWQDGSHFRIKMRPESQ
jgi:hypothetical protein